MTNGECLGKRILECLVARRRIPDYMYYVVKSEDRVRVSIPIKHKMKAKRFYMGGGGGGPPQMYKRLRSDEERPKYNDLCFR